MENNSEYRNILIQTSCYFTQIYAFSVVLGIPSGLRTGPGSQSLSLLCRTNRNSAGMRCRKTKQLQTGLAAGGGGLHTSSCSPSLRKNTEKLWSPTNQLTSLRVLTDKPVTDTVGTVARATKAVSVRSPDFLSCLTIYSTQLYLYSVCYSQDCLQMLYRNTESDFRTSNSGKEKLRSNRKKP